MRLHGLRQVPYEGLGHVGFWAREAGHELSESRCWEDPTYPDPADYDLLVILGGPMGVRDRQRLPWLEAEAEYVGRAVAAGTPTLGICLGAQLIASVLGAEVRRHLHAEIGWHRVAPVGAGDSILAPFFGAAARVMQWHYDTFDLPQGAVHLARSDACEHQAFQWREHVLGLQFHPEMIQEEVGCVVARDAPLPAGPYVQQPEEILRGERFAAARQVTSAFMDALQRRWSPLISAASAR